MDMKNNRHKKTAAAQHWFAHRVLALRVLDISLCGALLLSAAVVPKAGAQTAPKSGFVFGAKVTTGTIGSVNGARLAGAAYVRSSQLNADADLIVVKARGNQVASVNASGNVVLKINVPSRGGGAPARIETKSASASLDPVNRVLVLSGNVDGFYQLASGARNSLKGSKATVRFPVTGLFFADVAGGKNGVQLVIPPPQTPADSAQQIGTVTISGENLSIDDAKSTATVTGNARAVSSGGATRFDVSAPSFTVSRDASGAFNKLNASGRTLLKVDLPAAKPTSSTGNAGQSGGAHATYFEIAGDAATVETQRDASGAAQLGTLTFAGNVSGLYRLQNADGTTSDNRFTGDRAVIKSVGQSADDFQIEVSGAPVSIQTPFELGF